MITNHGIGHVFHLGIFSKITQHAHTKRWKAGLGLLRGFFNKLVLFICLESVLVATILFGTGYVAVLS